MSGDFHMQPHLAEDVNLTTAVGPLEAIRKSIEEERKANNELQIAILRAEIEKQPLRKQLTNLIDIVLEANVMRQVRLDKFPLVLLTNNQTIFLELQQNAQRFCSLNLIVNKIEMFEEPVMFIFGDADGPDQTTPRKPLSTTIFDLP